MMIGWITIVTALEYHMLDVRIADRKKKGWDEQIIERLLKTQIFVLSLGSILFLSIVVDVYISSHG